MPLPESGKATGEKPVDPILDSPGRVPIQVCRFIGAGAVEDVENNMKPMEVPPFWSSRYLVLNGGDKRVCIWNYYPSHWEHLLCQFAPSVP